MRFSESLLKQRSSNLSNRSLYLVTDTDDPFQGNKQQQSVALVFANVGAGKLLVIALHMP